VNGQAMLHPRAADLTGLQVGRLVVIGLAGKTADKHLKWLCQCSCGAKKEIASNSLMRANPVKSCGCMNKTTAQAKKRPGGSWNEGKSYSVEGGRKCYRTRHAWAKAAIREYGNKCQMCGWDKARCDVHHRNPKAEGGLHRLDNAIVLCPNCHREIHAGVLSCAI
jgi:predicted HNH restriction endonuclease